ncbi:hypothetical protein MLD38_003877 [Melastoma candidum]|uniref:Uncharacterized protein n=1 Tax=Melastoma candidum TaxID=119954 RepID=A0ACB9S423_9MYRT|nr:hypothetical protein MLD38_003877 [Melastoma candidum]
MINALAVRRKLRSKLPQRKRLHVSPPILCVSVASDASSLDGTGAGFSSRKRKLGEVVGELPESSCMDGFMLSGHGHGRRSSEVEEEAEKEEGETELTSGEFGGNECSESVVQSEITCVHQQQLSPGKSVEFTSKFSVNGNSDEKEDSSLGLKEIDEVSVEFCSERGHAAKRSVNNTAMEYEHSESSRIVTMPKLIEPAIEKSSQNYAKNHPDLACTEKISCCEESEFSSSYSSFLELQSELFQEHSGDYSELSQSSTFNESGSEFSGKSDEDLPPSPTFALLLQFRKQFIRSRVHLPENCAYIPDKIQSIGNIENVHGSEVEINYECLRGRERREVYLHNYGKEFGEHVLDLRSEMVHWIIEESEVRKLEDETLFLGVNLLDRFLSKGHFDQRRNLEIAGVACLTLAVRIEENQPYNSVRKSSICVGSEVYSRCEVVAMEWLVQEVLCFQCAMPTTYNFLWFYLKAAKADARVNKRVMDLAKLALLDHEQLYYWPSTVAAALVILASLDNASCHHHVTELHIRSKDDDLTNCIKSLLWLVKFYMI